MKNKMRNKGKFVKGHQETRGELSPRWKGNKVGYNALHTWINSRLGKPKICSNCGTTKAKQYHWANISNKYKREFTDWKRLCTSCHFSQHRQDGLLKGRWSMKFDKCKECNTIQIPHRAHGLCRNCYGRWQFQRKHPNKIRKKEVLSMKVEGEVEEEDG